jgi:hypothetical protein
MLRPADHFPTGYRFLTIAQIQAAGLVPARASDLTGRLRRANLVSPRGETTAKITAL